MKDFYSILGTDPRCSAGEINEAYSRLSEKFRPDLNPDDKYAQSRFREINEAYTVLNDPLKRSSYDQKFLKTKAPVTDEKHKIRKYYSKSNGINIFFTILLIAVTCIFGVYVIRAVSGSKTAQAKPALTASNIFHWHRPKHHKKKHAATGLVKAASSATQPIADTVTRPVSKQPAAIKPVVAATEVKTVAEQHLQVNHPATVETHLSIENNRSNNPVYLYTTSIKANETGVVHLREFDTFNSEVIKSIPGGATVAVLEKGRMYYKIRFDNAVGYVPKWTVLER